MNVFNGGEDNYELSKTLMLKLLDSWCDSGWEWGKSITHEEYGKMQKRKMECAF